jgi:putative oxidoreductase
MNTHSDVSDGPPAPSNNFPGFKANAFVREGFLASVAPVVLRWALAATILSAVADRFGLWGLPGTANVSWGDWPHFVAYTAKVNSFLPGVVAPALAVTATAAEAFLGVALLLPVFPRPVAWASAALLAFFAGAMTLSFGIKAPLNYSVFVDAAAALVLGAWPATTTLKSTRTRA